MSERTIVQRHQLDHVAQVGIVLDPRVQPLPGNTGCYAIRPSSRWIRADLRPGRLIAAVVYSTLSPLPVRVPGALLAAAAVSPLAARMATRTRAQLPSLLARAHGDCVRPPPLRAAKDDPMLAL
jgi:hypothetical protein